MSANYLDSIYIAIPISLAALTAPITFKKRKSTDILYFIVTSPASALPPIASLRPRTTPQYRSPLARLTRTDVTLARTKSTLSVALYEPWARATTA